jgi:hypothetical protein
MKDKPIVIDGLLGTALSLQEALGSNVSVSICIIDWSKKDTKIIKEFKLPNKNK